MTAVKVGVVPVGFPVNRLTSDTMFNHRDSVLDAIVNNNNPLIKPKFTKGVTFKTGWMIFNCADSQTADWLKNLPIWSQTGSVTIPEDQFPVPPVVYGHFGASASLESNYILKLIRGQNDGFDDKVWVVNSRSNVNGLAVVAFEVDDATVAILKARNFIIDYAFGQCVKLRLRQGKKNAQSDDEMICKVSAPPTAPAVTPAAFAAVNTAAADMEVDPALFGDNVSVVGSIVKPATLAVTPQPPSGTLDLTKAHSAAIVHQNQS